AGDDWQPSTSKSFASVPSQGLPVERRGAKLLRGAAGRPGRPGGDLRERSAGGPGVAPQGDGRTTVARQPRAVQARGLRAVRGGEPAPAAGDRTGRYFTRRAGSGGAGAVC